MSADSTLHFQNICWLWALLLLLPLTALFFYAQKQREQLLSKLVASRLYPSLVGRVSMVKRVLRAFLILLALGFLFVALAQPRLGYEEHSVLSHGRDIMIAIDTSRSMLATDVAPTRLARAKLLSEDVLELLPGDRIGLIAFAGKAFLQAPMTLDHGAVRDALNELDTNVIPKGGTNIAEAIRLTITALGKGEGTERALILMTDGEDLDGNALEAAKEAKKVDIKIFSLGIGSSEGSLIPILHEQKGNDFVRDEAGKPVLSKLDVKRLEEIASITGGFYEPFGGNAARTIVQQGILPLSGGNGKMQVTRRPIERYEWPLTMALFLLTLWWLLDERRRLPRNKNHSLTAATLKRGYKAFFLLLLLPTLAGATPGLSDYQQGNYKAALNTFEEQLKSGNASDAARFDAGAAAYKQGDYKKAVDYFTRAMTSSSPKIQQAATYNLANALVRAGEAATEGSEKLSDWNSALEHYDTTLKTDPKNRQAKENQAIVKKMIEAFKKEEEQKEKNQKQEQQKNPSSGKQQQEPNKNQQGNSSQQQDPQDQQPQQPQNQPQNSNQRDPQKKNDPSQDSQDQQNQKSTPPAQSEKASNNASNLNSEASPSPTPNPSEGSSSSLKNSVKPTSDSQQQQSEDSRKTSPTPSSNTQDASGSGSENQTSPNASTASSQDQKNSTGTEPMSQPSPGEKKQGTLAGGEQKAPLTTNAEQGNEGTMSKAQAEAILRSTKDEEQQVQLQRHNELEEATQDW